MKTLRIFLLGMFEFRAQATTNFEAMDDLEIYDSGRDFAHRITFRLFDRD